MPVHRARTSGSPAQVWEVLGNPRRWPQFDLSLIKVRGTPETVVGGQALVGVSRFASLSIPIDVVEVVPAARLVLRVHSALGVRETVTYSAVPMVGGGSELRVSVVVDGLFAPAAALPLWLAGGVTVRLLAVRVDRLVRAGRRAA